jgi:hypothetical protein
MSVLGHMCNPSYERGLGRMITVQSQFGQKCEILSENQTKKAKGLGV